MNSKVLTAFGGIIIIMLIAIAIIISSYKSYQNTSLKVLLGQEKTVILGHLIDAKLKGLNEMIPLSLTSQSSNDGFVDKVKDIDSDLQSLISEHESKSLEDTKKEVRNILNVDPQEALEDVFVHYRNIKASASNLYRFAWENKYMTAVRIVGQIIQDLDNTQYHDADKGLMAINARLTQLITVITRATIAQQEKIVLFSQINQLKSIVTRYQDVASRSLKIKDQRMQAIKRASVHIKTFNDEQSKRLSTFVGRTQEDYVKSLMVVAFAFTASALWFLYWRRKFNRSIKNFTTDLMTQVTGWVSADGNLGHEILIAKKFYDAEYLPLVEVLAQTHSKILNLNKQDAIIKKNILAPYVLINRARQAVYWNTSMSTVVKCKRIEDSGVAHYHSILKYAAINGKVMVDPVEKCFSDAVEVVKNVDVASASEQIPARIVCSPIFTPTGEVEYVLLCLRDLKEEFKLIDNEINKQLQIVSQSAEVMRTGVVPLDAPADARPALKVTITHLKRIAIEWHEHRELITGQLKSALERLAREGGLKRNMQVRVGQLSNSLKLVSTNVSGIEAKIERLTTALKDTAARDTSIKTEFSVLKKRGTDLQRNIRQEQELTSRCLGHLKQIDSLTKGIRTRERLIYGALEKATVANANNSILRSRPDVSIVEISSILDSVNILAEQFDRGYKFIEQAVDELENQYANLKNGLEESLATSSRLSQDDRGLIDTLTTLDKLTELAKDDYRNIISYFNELRSNVALTDAEIQTAEEKCKRIEKIGGASLELQTHMERGFKGILDLEGSA